MPRSEFSESRQQDIVHDALAATFESAAETHGVSVSTIRRWQRKHGIRRSQRNSRRRKRRRGMHRPGNQQQDVKGISALDELDFEATLSPERRLQKSMDNAAARFAAKQLRWFDGRRGHRRAVRELDEIIAEWERSNRKSARGNDAGVRPNGTGSSTSAPRAERSRDRCKESASRSSEARRVYVFDAVPIAELAAGASNAWVFLRRIVNEQHEMVVPEAVIELVETNMRVDPLLRAVLRCKYVKRVALEDHDERTAKMLCDRASSADIVSASVVIVANNCLSSLRKRCTRTSWSLEIVTSDLDDIRALVSKTNLEMLPENSYRSWHLLPLTRIASRVIRPVHR